LIVFSTLASGQHYFVDLIAAVPYAAIVLVGARRLSRPAAIEPAVIATEAAVPAGR
jgi:membrane-associated phospholipid phosphatase